MNDPPSDVNENVTDIFVLSISETVTSLFTEHLEKKGYRVTLFTDGSYLLETLRQGKPNLLICDSTTVDEEGFEICRQIKADEDLWVIPVLILTSGSTLTELLQILDCNADNFITHPFDLSYCLSVIDSMLSIPVERQTPEQIKTRFKISHNDQIYVVAANRRKLLEFLLSSFEITVNQSAELSRLKTEFQTLTGSAKTLEDRVLEQTRVIESIQETLQLKEQKISALTHEAGENKKILAQKHALIADISGQLDNDRTLLATYEENLRISVQERKDSESSLQSEISTLRKQISELVTEVEETRTNLDTVQGELDDEKVNCTSLECTLGLLVPQKELAEKTLHALTLEHDQLKSALTDEKNRALSAEQEFQRVLQAKTETEQELTLKTNSLAEEVKHQVADLVRMTGELESVTIQRISLEKKLESLQQEKDESETSLQSTIKSLKEQLGEVQEKYESTRAALETEESTTTSLKEQLGEVQEKYESTRAALETEKNITTTLKENLAEVIAEKERTLLALSLKHDQLKSAFSDEKNRALSVGQELQNVMQAKTAAEQELNLTITDLKEIQKNQEVELTRLKSELDEEAGKRASSENQVSAIRQEKEESETSLQSTIKSLKEQLGEVQEKYESTRAALETEESTTSSLKKDLAQVNAEKEKALLALSLEHDQLKSAFSDEKNRALSVGQELQNVVQAKTAAEQELNLAITDLKEIQKNQEVELTRLKSELEEEAGKRVSSENQVSAIRQAKEESESSFQSTIRSLQEQLGEVQEKYASSRLALETETGRTKSLKEHLADIIAEKEKTEEMLKTDRDSYKATFLRLKHDINEATAIPAALERELIAVKSQNKALTDELNLAYQGKAQISHQVRSLSEELEQVKADLVSVQDLHRAGDGTKEADKLNIQHLEEAVRTFSDERVSLNEKLENERRLRQIAEEKSKEAAQKQERIEQELRVIHDVRSHEEDERSIKLQNLKKEFELVGELQKSLEMQVNILKTEKLQAEKTIQTLTNELDQARTALADEWEDHMISVAASFKERQRLQGIPVAEGSGIGTGKEQETVAQEPVLPVMPVPPLQQALLTQSPSTAEKALVSEKEPAFPEPSPAVPEISKEAIHDIVNNFCDEDLFEEDGPVETKSGPVPKPAGDTGSGPEKDGEEFSTGSPVPAEKSREITSPDEDLENTDDDNDVDDDADEEYSDNLPSESAHPISHGVFTFSRKQWFDLLKWARHSGTLSHDQRIQIVRMGRLIQKGRKLTKKQEEQVNEMIALVQALGYRPA